MSNQDYGGSMRLTTGERVFLTPEQARAIWDACEADAARRAAEMPTEREALLRMGDAFQRLKELGWREATYCPKDGSSFDVIEAGSTGIHRAFYSGTWPDGGWWIEADGDLWPSHPILFRLDHGAEEARKAKMKAAAEAFAAEQEREVQS